MMNLKSAGEYINTLNTETVAVKTFPQKKSAGLTAAAIPLLDLYTNSRILMAEKIMPHGSGEGRPYETSLQFTREMPVGLTYRSEPLLRTKYMVVISGEPLSKEELTQMPLLQSSHVKKEFHLHTGVFRYKTLVTVFELISQTTDQTPAGYKPHVVNPS